MNKAEILKALTPEIVSRFKTAIELGKWADGNKLTDEQRQTCMQAVMVWEHEHLSEEERTGYIHKPKKDACASDYTPSREDSDDSEKPIKFS